MEKEFDATKIERYIKGELDEVEKQAFELLIEQDEELAEEVDFYRTSMDAVDVQGAILEAERRLADRGFFAEKKARKGKLITFRALTSAAAVALLLLIGWWYGETHYSDAVLAVVDPGVLAGELETARRLADSGQTTDIFSDGLQALQQEDYHEANQFFAQVDKAAPTYVQALLFLTYSNLRSKNYEAALENSQRIEDLSQDIATVQKAQWLRAKASIGQGVPEKELLAEIADDDNHRFQRDARLILRQLDSYWRKLIP